MPCKVYLGPMKGEKSGMLLSEASRFELTDKKIKYIIPEIDVRSDGLIKSRARDVSVKAEIHSSLSTVGSDFDVAVIDEVHMYGGPEDAATILGWLAHGKYVCASGLYLDYGRKMPVMIRNLIQLNAEVVQCYAKCDYAGCDDAYAEHTQIFKEGEPVTSGLPSIVPEDGTYSYEPRCSAHHVFDPLYAFSE